jgi:hypothetical protein
VYFEFLSPQFLSTFSTRRLRDACPAVELYELVSFPLTLKPSEIVKERLANYCLLRLVELTVIYLLFDEFVKSQFEVPRWLDKKFDIQGVVFLAGPRLYMWYVEGTPETYNEGDRTFYDAIIV